MKTLLGNGGRAPRFLFPEYYQTRVAAGLDERQRIGDFPYETARA
jgi:hypothetical protein